jgi:hypothetical protein
MTHTTSFRIPTRAALLAIAAVLAVPAAASAMPDRAGAQTHRNTPALSAGEASMHPVGQPWVSPSMHRVGQPWPSQSASGGSVPSTRVDTTVVHTPTPKLIGTTHSGFDWTDALIGAAVAAAAMALVGSAAVVVRRRTALTA